MARRAVTIGTIAAVAVLVLVVAGGVTGLLRPGSGPASHRASGSIGSVGAAVPIAATSPPGSTAPDPAGEPIAQTGKTQVKPEAAVRAVCAVMPAELQGLTEITPDQTVESLRDAIPLLQDRLDQVSSAAVGRPALKPVLARLERIGASWERAVAASDAKHPAVVKKALASGRTQIKALTADLRKAYPAGGSDC